MNAILQAPCRSDVVSPSAPPHLVLAFDAEPGREGLRDAVKATVDGLFAAAPKGLTAQLLVNGNSRLHTIGKPTKNIGTIRGQIGKIRCQHGQSQITQILEWARRQPSAASAVIVFGERYDEFPVVGYSLADALLRRGTRVIIIHDPARCSRNDAFAFGGIAARAGGCVVPVDADHPDGLRDIFSAISTLAVGGIEMLEAQVAWRPAARHLLSRLNFDNEIH